MYNMWKDPGVETTDKVLGIAYIISAYWAPFSVAVSLLILYFLRKQTPAQYKKHATIAMCLVAVLKFGSTYLKSMAEQ